jgi:hypothetical protein
MLTGIIIACEEIADGATLRAELPVAGQTVLEQQAHLLTEAGAERVIAIAERLPPGLSGAVTRLRRDGLAVEVLRHVHDVAQRVKPDERLLFIGDGIVADDSAVERLLAAPAPAILVLPDAPGMDAWELIDSSSRWAGLLLADGELVRRTARMLGDWDLQSTLLRNAVQSGAERVGVGIATPLLAQIVDPASALAVEQAIGAAATRRHAGLLDRHVFDPLARLIAPHAMAALVDPAWLRAGSAGLLLLSAITSIMGWPWAGLLLAMLSGPVDTLGRHIGALSMRSRRDGSRWPGIRYGAAGAALLAMGWAQRPLGWGTIALAAATLGFMTALFEHERLIGRPARRPLWLAEPDALVWLLLPFALGGWWTAGLAAQASFAFASLLAAQRLTARQR